MKILMTLIVSMAWLSSLNAATYSYQGSPYQNAYGDNYTTQMSVSGYLETSEVLGPNMSASEILPLIVGYSFNDGVQTLNHNNSEFILFHLTTDENGMPNSWIISMGETPLPELAGEIFSGIYLTYFSYPDSIPFGIEELQGGFSEPCLSDGFGNECSDVAQNVNAGTFSLFPSDNIPPDHWQFAAGGGSSAVAVPVNQANFLVVLSLLVLLMTFYVLKRKQGNGI